MTLVSTDMAKYEASPRADVIQLAMAADAGFMMPLGVALTSLCEAHAPGELAVTILHDGVPAADIARVERSVAGRIPLTWRQVAPEEVAGAHFSTFLTAASLFRLLLPQFLPEQIERVIYLDCDVVVTASLRELWELELGSTLLAAARDAGSPFPAGPCGTEWERLGLDPGAPYFNTGVLVIPVAAWREADVPRRTLEVLRASEPRWGDQDGLNVVLQGRWTELSRRWNLQTPDVDRRGLAWALWRDDVEAALDAPAIIHYTEREKPWSPGAPHPLADRWYEVLDRSDWRGWRPGSGSRSLVRRTGSRVKSAWRALTAKPVSVSA